MILIAQRNFEDFLALAAYREGKLAVASPVVASDERGTRLQPVHLSQLHQFAKSAIYGGRMGNS